MSSVLEGAPCTVCWHYGAMSCEGVELIGRRKVIISAREDEAHAERQYCSDEPPRTGSEPRAMPQRPQRKGKEAPTGKQERNRGVGSEVTYGTEQADPPT